MSLRVKFGILLGLLGLAVLLVAGASWGTFEFLRREVREPILSMSHVLQRLGSIKREVQSLQGVMADTGVGLSLQEPSPEAREEFSRAAASALRVVASIAGEKQSSEEWALRTSKTSLRNIQSRLGQTRALSEELFRLLSDRTSTREQQVTLRNECTSGLSDIQRLLESMETRLIADTRLAIGSSDDVRPWLLLVLGSALLIVALSVILGVILVRRWVLLPVEQLRLATARIAEGEFTYRIPTPANADANDELLRLSAEVNLMAGMIKTMQDDRVQQEKAAALGGMLKRLAHNLRSPLTGIRGLAEHTRDDLSKLGPHTAQLQHFQDMIITSADRFTKWLDSLIRTDRPMDLRVTRTEVRPWIHGLVEAHRPAAQSLGVSLTLDTDNSPEWASFDAEHLEHAVSAILSNAIEATSSPEARVKAGTDGGAVAVAVARHQEPNADGQGRSFWEVCVRDEGPGISPDVRANIFRQYFTTKARGTGIGLAVALQAVKAHGGEIRVESRTTRENGEPGPLGSRFRVVLPFSDVEVDSRLAMSGQNGASVGQNSPHRG